MNDFCSSARRYYVVRLGRLLINKRKFPNLRGVMSEFGGKGKRDVLSKQYPEFNLWFGVIEEIKI